METDAYDDDVPACSSCEDAQKDYAHLEMVAKNLAAIVRRLAHELRGVSTDHDLPGKALDYLKREGFAGQPIRKVGAGSTARPPTPTGWSDTDWLKHLQEQQHPLAGMHINQGSMDAAAQIAELKELNENHAFNAKYFKAEYEKSAKKVDELVGALAYYVGGSMNGAVASDALAKARVHARKTVGDDNG